MDFGAELDDDFFEQPKKTNKETPISRDLKFSTAEWFLETSAANTGEELLKCLRYKADYLYFLKDYVQASKVYERCIELIPASNVPAKRECMEGLSRSLLNSGHTEKALECALKMHAAAESADHKVASWNLLATVCHSLGKYEEELEALHCCLESHKTNPDLWLRLAFCYSGLFKICLPYSGYRHENFQYCCDFKARTFIPIASSGSEESVLVPVNISNTDAEKSIHVSKSKDDSQNHINDRTLSKCEMCILGTQIISACLIRTRLLLNSCSKTNEIFIQKKSHVNEKVGVCLTHMEIDQDFIDEASKMLKSELYCNSMAKHNAKLQSDCSSESHCIEPPR